MPFMLAGRKTLTDTERQVLDLLLEGDEPVLDLLRRQVETVEQVYRYRLGGSSLASGPDLFISLSPNRRARSLSTAAKARRLPGFADLIVQVGRSTMLPVLHVHNGFISQLAFLRHHGTVPNAVKRAMKDYGYKACGHWDDHECGHLPELGARTRPALDVTARYTPRPKDAPRSPKWLRSVEDRVDVRDAASVEATAEAERLAGVSLPPDLLAFLSWTNGVEVDEAVVLSAEEIYLLDTETPTDQLLVVGTDLSGDVYALDLTHPTDGGDYPVLHLTHDPVGRRGAAARVRPWLTRLLREDGE